MLAISSIASGTTKSRRKKKRLPAYGKQLLQGRRNPRNDIFLCVGKKAWSIAKGKRSIVDVLVMPNDGTTPMFYDWSVVKKASVLVLETSDIGEKIIRSLAYELLKAGAEIVRVICSGKSLLVFRR
jgi:hypothetical protein